MDAKAKFQEWLRSNGAQVLPETNSYELARFVAKGQTCVIYEGRRGVRANGMALACWVAFRSGVKYFQMGETQKPRTPMSKMKLVLRQRDGDCCFFCGLAMFELSDGRPETPLCDDCTLEHLVGRAKGGPDHEDNLVLAHERCNKEADNLPLMEKIKIREANLHGYKV